LRLKIIPDWYPAVEWTGGGLVSTSRDLARWRTARFTGRAMTGHYLMALLRAIPVAPDLTDLAYSKD
jgi:D-alanyl-D-alanine carboxypeptidase